MKTRVKLTWRDPSRKGAFRTNKSVVICLVLTGKFASLTGNKKGILYSSTFGHFYVIKENINIAK